VMTADFEPVYPDPAVARPLVVHASTAPIGKGTPAVLAAIERLRGTVDFEFVLLERVPRPEALATIARADVYLDQFMIGTHGSAAVEAMAMGKPVVGYLSPALAAGYPAEIPLVSASQESLADVLGELLRDGSRRHELGHRSRAYAEQHHDAVRLAEELRAVYEGVIDRARRARAS
jgi:glycosyltransferase involved in cell wall biosynthesis